MKTRIVKLERTAMFSQPLLPARRVIVEPWETKAEAYQRTYGEQIPTNAEELYRMVFILLVEPGPGGGYLPDPSQRYGKPVNSLRD